MIGIYLTERWDSRIGLPHRLPKNQPGTELFLQGATPQLSLPL
ncbi:hypothetical protein [Leptolyngbya sp. FACHB-321]|nr:hypothetical protein [Leptolyngbya sp. FACHB-321]